MINEFYESLSNEHMCDRDKEVKVKMERDGRTKLAEVAEKAVEQLSHFSVQFKNIFPLHLGYT